MGNAARAAHLAEEIDGIIHTADQDELLALVVVLDGRRALLWELIRERRRGQRPTHEHRRAITVKAAAERLSCHDDTIRTMCREGKLRAFEVSPGHYRIPESALDELMNGTKGKDRKP